MLAFLMLQACAYDGWQILFDASFNDDGAANTHSCAGSQLSTDPYEGGLWLTVADCHDDDEDGNLEMSIWLTDLEGSETARAFGLEVEGAVKTDTGAAALPSVGENSYVYYAPRDTIEMNDLKALEGLSGVYGWRTPTSCPGLDAAGVEPRCALIASDLDQALPQFCLYCEKLPRRSCEDPEDDTVIETLTVQRGAPMELSPTLGCAYTAGLMVWGAEP